MPPTWGSPADSPLIEIKGAHYRALVWRPPKSDDARPCLIHLHGAGEAGSNVWEILAEGQTGTPPVSLHFGSAPPELAENFVVVAPQSPRSTWDAKKVSEFAHRLLTEPPPGANIDPSRVVISGHSNGASASLEVAALGMRSGDAAAPPLRFAACVPVAPGGCRAQPSELRDTPTWIFHGVNDAVLPVRCADTIHGALRQQIGSDDDTRLRYTRFERCPPPPGYPHLDGHGTPVVAWVVDGLWRWLLGHRAATCTGPK
jgi:predicted peptidase